MMKTHCKTFLKSVLLGATLLGSFSQSASALTTPPQTTAEHQATDTLITASFETLNQYLIELLRGMTGQLSAADQIGSRQMGSYFDGQIQEMHKLAQSEALYKTSRDSQPPRTLCETATGLAGAAAATQNSRDIRTFMSDVKMAEMTNRQGGPTANGAAAHAQYRAAEILNLYCDPEAFNTEGLSPCLNSRPDMIDADINPTKTIYSSEMVLDSEQFDAANSLITNIVQPISNESLRGAQLNSQDGRVLYAMRRGDDARKGFAVASLSGLVADVTPSTKMGQYVNAMTAEANASNPNTSKMKLYSTLLSDRFLNGTYHLKLNGMNSSTMLLREANNNFANIQVAMFELMEQNRELIALNAALLATVVDANDEFDSRGLQGEIIDVGAP